MKRIVLLCGCLLVWGSAGAQLTLDSCRLLARNHYPEIRRYDLVRQTEEYTLSNARREWLPQLSLSAQATWQTAVPAFPDALTGMLTQYGVGMPGMNKDQYKVQLEVTQTIWDGGKSAADKRIAEAEAAEQRQATDVDLYALEGPGGRPLFRHSAARRTGRADETDARTAAEQPRQGCVRCNATVRRCRAMPMPSKPNC